MPTTTGAPTPSTTQPPATWQLLTRDQWHEAQEQHAERADTFTAGHRTRRAQGKSHPVWDFLFEYYPLSPAKLRRWHPGIGTVLEGKSEHAEWKDYAHTPDATWVDVDAWWERRGKAAHYIEHLLSRETTNPAHFDCFGLHEWAMVYRTDTPRHGLPLRLGAAGTNEVVESHQLRCTHYDAFRFFTPPARPLNLTVLEREDQPNLEQRGCLHAGMDLYKWAFKLGPLVPGELLLDAFELARDCRILDMEASPYDCRELGFGVVPIETPAGKAEYVSRQRQLATRADGIRDRLLSILSPLTRSRE